MALAQGECQDKPYSPSVQNEATGMNTYTIQDAQEERQRIAEQRRKREQEEKDDYWFRESVGLPNGRVPAEFLSGEFT